jgi:hypothetical protein
MIIARIAHKCTLDETDSLDEIIKRYEADGFVFATCTQLVGGPMQSARLREAYFVQTAQHRAEHEARLRRNQLTDAELLAKLPTKS